MNIRASFSDAGVMVGVVIADRLTKTIAAHAADIPLIPGILSLRNTRNSGVAFSLLSGNRLLLCMVTALFIISIIAYLAVRTSAVPRAVRIGLWMVAGGGMGNLWDRIVHGSVIDFLECKLFRFPIFNVADICICAGVGLILLGSLIAERSRK